MHEQVIQFGDQNSLVGILCSPEIIKPDTPALIMINAGALHRVGPCRSAVSMARYIAQQGYQSFRFDLPGIGDSGFGSTASDVPLAAKKGILQAMDALEVQCGTSTFILHGLCAGARDAFNAAVADERVTGLSMIDSHAYRTLTYYRIQIIDFLRTPSRWLNAIQVRLLPKKINVQSNKEEQQLFENPLWEAYPSRKLVEAGFKKLTQRKVKILATYTGTWAPEYNYKEQFKAMYSGVNFGSLLTINFMPEATHTMPVRAHQQQVASLLLETLTTSSKQK